MESASMEVAKLSTNVTRDQGGEALSSRRVCRVCITLAASGSKAGSGLPEATTAQEAA
jgi:hypothetical protein